MKNKVKIGTLPNGLRYYATFDNSSWVAGIGVKCGGAHDPPGMSGMAHLVEHLLARKSLEYDPLEAELMYEKFMGGPEADIKVETTNTSTFYGHDGLPLKWHVQRCFKMFAGMVLDRALDNDGIVSEKSAVLQEYFLNGRDNVLDALSSEALKLIYTTNPIRRRVDCEPEDLKRIGRKDIRAFLRRHYIPNNMFVIILGPSFNDVRKMAKRYFGDLEPKSIPSLEYDHSDDFPVLSTIKSHESVWPILNQYHLDVCFPTEAYDSQDAEALDVLSRIWALRMRHKLRSEHDKFGQGVYRALSEVNRTFLNGTIELWCASSDAGFIKYAEQEILNETKKLKEGLVTQEEFDAITFNLELQHRAYFQYDPDNLASMIIEAVCNGDEELVGFHAYPQKLKKVTRSKLREVANKYFTDAYARVLIGPSELK